MKNIFDSNKGFKENVQITSTLEPQGPLLDLSQYTEDELLEIRAHLDELLPSTRLKHLNLHQESVIQFIQTKKLLNEVLDDDTVPVNQKAQISNTVQSNLQHLQRMQKENYDFERFKQVENLLIDYINEMPDDEAKVKFLSEWVRRLGEI